MKPILCSDKDKYVAATHRHNFPQIPFIEGDLSKLEIEETIIKTIGKTEVDFLVGGPPLSGIFSIFGERRFLNTQNREYNPYKEPRNKLVHVYLNYIKK